MVKAFCQFKVSFENPNELSKVFVFKNLGVIHEKMAPPPEYKGINTIWNLNLPVYLQKHSWEINNFQTNFKKLKVNATGPQTITAGKKTLSLLNFTAFPTKNVTAKDLADEKTDQFYL